MRTDRVQESPQTRAGSDAEQQQRARIAAEEVCHHRVGPSLAARWTAAGAPPVAGAPATLHHPFFYY